MSEFNVHPEIAKIRSVHLAEVEGLKADKALVEEQLRQSKQDCMRFKCELDAMGKQVETTWASERMANAVLRERINDVANEVVRVAAALEGLGSPIESLIEDVFAEPTTALREQLADPLRIRAKR